MNKVLKDQPYGCLQPHDAEGRIVKCLLLFIVMMGGMVCSQGIQRSIQKPFDDRLLIFSRPERWIHLGVGIVALHCVIGEKEVMRRGFSRHPHTTSLGLADKLHPHPGGDMLKMDASPGQLRDQKIPGDMDVFRSVGFPPQPHPGGDGPLIHDPTSRKPHILRVVSYRNVKSQGVLQCPTHESRVHHGESVIGNPNGTSLHKFPNRGEALPFLAHGKGTHGIHAGKPCGTSLGSYKADRRRRIDHRIGVGHGTDRRESTRHRGGGPGGDRLLMLSSRFPEVHMDIDQPRGDHEATAA